MPRNTFVLLILGALLVLAQPPAILQEGIRNEASRIPPSLPGGALSPGSRVVIQGLRFPPDAEVQLKSGQRNWQVRALDSRTGQMVWQVPLDVPAGAATITIRNEDGESRPYAIRINGRSGGLYSQNNVGWGAAHAHRRPTKGETESLSHLRPAHPGEDVIMESTGTGQDLQLTVGGLPATARWVPLAEGRAEILLTLPASTPLGCYVPVQIRYRQGLTGNTVTLPVAAPGLPCENKTLWPPSTTASKEPIGLLLLTRTNLLIELPGQSGVRIVDEEAALHFFTPVTSAQAPPVESLPPPGTCVTYHGLYQPEFSLGKNLLQMLQGRLPGALRDAGRSIALQGPSGKATIPDEDGYFALIGGERPDYGRAARPLFLASGEYVARALGGAQVGPFEAAFRMPQALEGRNFSSLGTIDRGRGAVVAWHGGARESATYIIAVSVRHSTTAFGVAFCAVRAGLREFRLPPEALANLPETEQDTTMPLNLIFVLSMPAPTNFQAKGLREGFIVPITVAGRNVNFR